mmetsp:Transcript_10229/g.17560  ORF Transcript_10229/g.17560 Transcript_10229/m.17560 type:complete len:94 (-) Transcript_10229:1113-1394(-)
MPRPKKGSTHQPSTRYQIIAAQHGSQYTKPFTGIISKIMLTVLPCLNARLASRTQNPTVSLHQHANTSSLNRCIPRRKPEEHKTYYSTGKQLR